MEIREFFSLDPNPNPDPDPNPNSNPTPNPHQVRERIAAFSGDDLDMLEPLQVLTQG